METTSYNLIQPPFSSLKFRDMPKKELKDYFHWFHKEVPHRIEELSSAVNLSPGFEAWRPTYAPDSLDALGCWFATQVKTRQHTPEELSKLPSHVREYMTGGELTDRTISLAIDLAMYLSQILLRNSRSLSWDQPFGSRRFIDYGQPVLVGFTNGVPVNPVRAVIGLAYGIVEKTKSGKGLRDIYDSCMKKVKDSLQEGAN